MLAVVLAGSPRTESVTVEFKGVPCGETRIENEVTWPAFTMFVAGESAKVNPETATVSVLVLFGWLASAPPETFAVDTKFAAALLATVTVNVIIG